MKEIVLNIKDILKSTIAYDDEDGNKVYEEIKKAAQLDNTIILDFKEIELVNTAFLNNAIGVLFDENNYDLKKNRVIVKNMDGAKLEILKETIEVAREKFKKCKSIV